MLRDPKEIQIPDQAGNNKTFKVHKFSAYDGREIVTQYPSSGAPKIGDYKRNEELSLKMMHYVSIADEQGNEIVLVTKELVNNHTVDWETLGRLEIELMRYNCSFFQNGKASDFFTASIEQAKELITSMLTDLLGQSSQASKQQSEN